MARVDGPALGIDFGTTRSSAAIALADRRLIRVKDPANGVWSIPSAVCARDGDYAVGAAALFARRLRPQSFVENFKREFAEAPNQTISLGPPAGPEAPLGP